MGLIELLLRPSVSYFNIWNDLIGMQTYLGTRFLKSHYSLDGEQVGGGKER